MFSDKLKNLFKRTIESNEDESIFERAANLINSNRRTIPENKIAEFQEYLDAMPWQDIKTIKNRKPKPKKTATLRP